MIQRKNNQKRTKFSLLPSDEPVTMRDRFDSFYDQFLYDSDYEKTSEEYEKRSEQTSICAVWPRPRFMLQINTPLASSIQPFYQNKLNIMPTVKINQTTGPLIYQKRKYHTKKEDNIGKSNYSSLSASSSQNTYLSKSEELGTGLLQQNEQNLAMPQIQINTPQLSNNSNDFTSSSQNESINSSQSQNEEVNQFQEQENEESYSTSDSISPLSSSLSQPHLAYQQLKAKKMKAKIIQHPLNVSGIQFAFQQQEQLMKLTPYQKLQQIQQMQKLQSKNKVQVQKQTQKQNETDINNEGAQNEAENVNGDDNNDLQNDPNKEAKKRKYKPRQSFTPEQKMMLEKFILDHIDHPYAEHEDLVMLERQTKLSRKQIRVFMTNTRMRKFAGNKIPVLKKSGNIVMRKGVPLHGQLGRVDPKNQCLIQCFSKKMGYPLQIPIARHMQPEPAINYNKSIENQSYLIKDGEHEGMNSPKNQ